MFKKILATLALLLSATLALAAVDVNKATEAELDSVKGIGPGTSKIIMTERKKGDFKDWNDFITRVKGVGEKRAENLSEAGLTVGGKSYKPAATGAAAKNDKKDAAKDAKKSADAKADATADKKEAKADAKAEKKEAKADAKQAKAEAKAEEKKDKAEASKTAASAPKK
ncbi:ComEA family DNA-binding protein [Ramlibacter humi]|uniref:Helix-hairpin-helix domain-containing protein n=1 Tax=Ramlibacter humi TaxID=2530451 RepID=A0A4Z0BQI2_9BURK|nr:helix-hairpin-helix domain-containing protein [Ramlibacter humi]TFZ00305.1 hypothetical protein EZ216_14500 [Ramlibacter humi]